jgi:activating signal cointegrator 1
MHATIAAAPARLGPIPALTLWQPWASLIQIGVKPFETRGWATAYRGPLAIHAGTDRRGLALCRGEPEIEQALADAGYLLTFSPRDIDRGWRAVPLGSIVAVADLVQCWRAEDIVAEDLADPFDDYSPGRWAWHLHRVQALPEPIKCKGLQGLWHPPLDIQDRLRELAPPRLPVRAGAQQQRRRRLDNDACGIVGTRLGGDPPNEAEHFYICAECGQAVDMRDLGQVFHHEEPGHEPHDLDD